MLHGRDLGLPTHGASKQSANAPNACHTTSNAIDSPWQPRHYCWGSRSQVSRGGMHWMIHGVIGLVLLPATLLISRAVFPDALVADGRRLEIHGIYLDADLMCWHDLASLWHICHHEIVSDLPSDCTGSPVHRSPSGCDIQFITIDIGSDTRKEIDHNITG